MAIKDNVGSALVDDLEELLKMLKELIQKNWKKRDLNIQNTARIQKQQ